MIWKTSSLQLTPPFSIHGKIVMEVPEGTCSEVARGHGGLQFRRRTDGRHFPHVHRRPGQKETTSWSRMFTQGRTRSCPARPRRVLSRLHSARQPRCPGIRRFNPVRCSAVTVTYKLGGGTVRGTGRGTVRGTIEAGGLSRVLLMASRSPGPVPRPGTRPCRMTACLTRPAESGCAPMNLLLPRSGYSRGSMARLFPDGARRGNSLHPKLNTLPRVSHCHVMIQGTIRPARLCLVTVVGAGAVVLLFAGQ
jgi:hypothetical protein